MLPWVCSVIDHRRRQNVVRTSVTHSAIASCATFLFLPHFDVICDLLLNRRTARWNLFVKGFQGASGPSQKFLKYSPPPPPRDYSLLKSESGRGSDSVIYRSVIFVATIRPNKLKLFRASLSKEREVKTR